MNFIGKGNGRFDFTGFSGKLGAISLGLCLGNLTFSKDMSTTASTTTFTIRADGNKQLTLKTNGQILDFPINFAGTITATNTVFPPSITLLDDLTLGPTNGNLTISTYCNFDANVYNITCVTATISTLANYTVKFGKGIWTVTGATFTMSGSAVSTINAGSAIIRMTSSSAKTFTTPSSANPLPALCQAGSGALTITGTAGTFNDIFASVFPSTISLGGSYSCNNFTLSGRPGALVTLNSTVAATGRILTKVGGGTVSCNFLSIQDSTPSGGNWYAGPDSTRVSNFGIWSASQAPNSNMMDIV